MLLCVPNYILSLAFSATSKIPSRRESALVVLNQVSQVTRGQSTIQPAKDRMKWSLNLTERGSTYLLVQANEQFELTAKLLLFVNKTFA